VQASWIGYPETTGLSAIDYYIADPHSAPPGPIDALYVEKLVRLPASIAFQAPEGAPEVAPLPALRRGHLTFGTFNRSAKLGPRVIALWSRVLRSVPGSRLLLAHVNDQALRERLESQFQAQGIDPGRLQFHPRLPMPEYLALHSQVDVVLDTFPYTGGTTTQLALWMGVPVVTLSGLRRAERIGTANVTRVGLQDWSVDSEEAFVARAVAAARDLEGLAGLRAGLRDRIASSPLRRPDLVTRSFEQALRTMWTRWCEGSPAQLRQPRLVPADPRQPPRGGRLHGRRALLQRAVVPRSAG
jgi:predicted O-linked N-acetylglucosamine transferase (SPINDLY family)